MSTLFYVIFALCVLFLGISAVAATKFRGSSVFLLRLLNNCNGIGYVLLIILLISMFWVTPWWVPILMLIGIFVIGGIGATIGDSGNVIFALISIVLYIIGFAALFIMRFGTVISAE